MHPAYQDVLRHEQQRQHFGADSVALPPSLEAFWKLKSRRRAFFSSATGSSTKVCCHDGLLVCLTEGGDDIAVVTDIDAAGNNVRFGGLNDVVGGRREEATAEDVDVQRGSSKRQKKSSGKATSSSSASFLSSAKEIFTTFDLNPKNGKEVITVSRNLLIRVWDISGVLEGENRPPRCKRSWAGLHSTPVSSCCFHPSGEYFATGSTDGSVKMWSVFGGFCTHNLSGHQAIISELRFKQDPSHVQLVIGDASGSISVWDLNTSDVVQHWLKNHMTAVTSCAFSLSGHELITSSRDRVVNIWSLKSFELLMTVPVLELVESVCVLPQSYFGSLEKSGDPISTCIFCTAGSNGYLRVWKFFNPSAASIKKSKAKSIPSGPTCECILQQTAHVQASLLLVHLHERKKELLSVSTDSVFSLISFPDLSARKQIVANDDEILDLAYLNESRRVLMATNSPLLRVMHLDTFSSQLLSGHKAPILGVSVFPPKGYRRIHLDNNGEETRYPVYEDDEMFVSVSKDQTARVWLQYRVEEGNEDKNLKYLCLYVCKGHTQEITCVSCSNGTAGPFGCLFLATASSDKTIKVWTVPDKKLRTSWQKAKQLEPQVEEESFLVAHITEIAHSASITDVSVCPSNDNILASSSLDKTAKIWEITSNRLMIKATLRGHSRAVSSVVFSSPESKMIATSSTDKTVRIWSLTDFSCLRTLEGHGAAVMCVRFVPGSKNIQQPQVISASSDGTMKVWTLKSSQCIQTLASSADEDAENDRGAGSGHDDKIWSFVVSHDATEMISVGSSSTLCIWKDCAEEVAKEVFNANRERLVNDEQLVRAFRGGDLKTATVLALSLEKPHTLRQILESILSQNSNIGKKSAATDEMQSLGAADSSVVNFLVELVQNEQLQNPQRDIARLIGYAKEWNTTTRSCHIAQLVIRALLLLQSQGILAPQSKSSTSDLEALVRALIPYTERHLRRVDKLLRDSFLFDHALLCGQNLT